MFAIAMAYALGVGSVFVAQYVYVRRQQARERESLVRLEDARCEVPGAVVIELFREKRRVGK